jgi:hypothetical protein
MVKWGGTYAVTGVDPVQILKSQKLLTKIPGGATLIKSERWVRPGHFLTKITAGGNTQYYFTHTKVGKVLAAPAPTTTVFAVSNPHAFVAGDLITVGAAAATILTVDYPSSGQYPQALISPPGGTGAGTITTTAAITLPTAGMRVFSQTSANNKVDCISLNDADYDPTSDQAVEVAISGIFLQTVLENLYHTDDIQALNAAATTGAGMILESAFQAYRWS